MARNDSGYRPLQILGFLICFKINKDSQNTKGAMALFELSRLPQTPKDLLETC